MTGKKDCLRRMPLFKGRSRGIQKCYITKRVDNATGLFSIGFPEFECSGSKTGRAGATRQSFDYDALNHVAN